MECQIIKLKHKRMCAGDLDRKVTIYSRRLDAPGETVDYENVMTKKFRVWAGIKTAKGKNMFYGTNENEAVTHVFYTRFHSCVSARDWVEYKCQMYDIVETENIDERDEWLALFCNVRGDAEEEMNYA